MECKDYREIFPAKLCGELSDEQENLLRSHLAGCEECRKEFEASGTVWNLLGELPQAEPSPDMPERFSAVLGTLKRKSSGNRNPFRSLVENIGRLFSPQALPKLAFSILLLATGLISGYLLKPTENGRTYMGQIDSLSTQVSELRQMMMLSLLRDQSASMRLQAISYTEELTSVDKKVTEALLMTLNKDPNVNVRLATLEALAKLADEPMVREGLVRSIENQESPIVQSAIADVMVTLNEKNAVEELKKLLGRKDLNQAVKINIEQSIQKLI